MRSELPLDNPDALRAFRQGQAAARSRRPRRCPAGRRAFPRGDDDRARLRARLRQVGRVAALGLPAQCAGADEAFPVAQDAIAQALRRDEGSGEAYAALADLHVEKDRDWTRAESTFRQALDLQPEFRVRAHPVRDDAVRARPHRRGRGADAGGPEPQPPLVVAARLRGCGTPLRQALPRSRPGLRGDAAARLAVHGRVDWPLQGLHGARPVHAVHRRLRAGPEDRAPPSRRSSSRSSCRSTPTRGAPPKPGVISPGSRASTGTRPNGDTAFWLALAYISLNDQAGRVSLARRGHRPAFVAPPLCARRFTARSHSVRSALSRARGRDGRGDG